MATEEKWLLTEMSTSDLSDIISQSKEWETLRAALQSYTKYAWEEDMLEISEYVVTIADDMCESKNMVDILLAMLNAVKLVDLSSSPHNSHETTTVSECCHEHLSEDEFDRRGRQMLENLVLREFARKVAAQYLLKKEESRAQRIALELELELLQEEEQQMRAAEKKEKKRKKKKTRLANKRATEREELQADHDNENNDSNVVANEPVTRMTLAITIAIAIAIPHPMVCII